MGHADDSILLPNHQRFDSEVVRSMSVAYANVCRALGLSTEPAPATEVVALKIMEIAERGARTPAMMYSACHRGIPGWQVGPPQSGGRLNFFPVNKP